MVPNASDLELFQRNAAQGRAFRQRFGIDHGRIMVGYLGTLGRINGVAYLVQVAAALKDDTRFSFLTVGDGQESGHVAALARSEGVLDRNLLMLSKISQAQVPALLSAVDVAASLFLPLPHMQCES